MSIDFSTLQGLSIPEGVVTQIADAAGVILWSAVSDKVILEVEKITSDTYAGETTYTGEQFILLDIYPKTNGTVNVTYGGLTKTITDTSGAAEPNAQQVFFGTFNGVSDSVTTPASGELTIEGDYRGFACGIFETGKIASNGYTGIKSIGDLGLVEFIPSAAFGVFTKGCEDITTVKIPSSVKSIGDTSFAFCTGLTNVIIPSSVATIGQSPFYSCNINNPVKISNNPLYKIEGNCLVEKDTNTLISGFLDSNIPSGVCYIGRSAFNRYFDLMNITIPSSVIEIRSDAFGYCTSLESVTMSSGVTTIESLAFYECTNLRELTLSEDLTVIGDSAFAYCESLESVVIPSSVTTIENGAFEHCTNLTSVTMLSPTPPEIPASSVFAYDMDSNSLPLFKVHITVPKGSLEAYKAEQAWNNFVDMGLLTEAS